MARLKYTEYPTSTEMPQACGSGRYTPQLRGEQRKGPQKEPDEGQGGGEGEERGFLSDSKRKQHVDSRWERVVEARWNKGNKAKVKEGRVVCLE